GRLRGGKRAFSKPSPPRRRGPLSVYATPLSEAASGPRLRGGDDEFRPRQPHSRRSHFQPALHARPRQPRIQPALDTRKAIEPDNLARLVESDQIAHPAEQRDVGDAVIVTHD